MRQVGFLAAVGLFALEHGQIYIQKDHDNARMLADIINCHKMKDILNVNLNTVHTNIVFAESKEKKAFEIVNKLKEK